MEEEGEEEEEWLRIIKDQVSPEKATARVMQAVTCRLQLFHTYTNLTGKNRHRDTQTHTESRYTHTHTQSRYTHTHTHTQSRHAGDPMLMSVRTGRSTHASQAPKMGLRVIQHR